MEGEVKWFDDTKGWGFIVPDGGGEECFVHRTAVEGGRRLKEGDRVEFHIEKDERGRIAAGEVKKV
ncbi:MAG: cold shock domain-containing protein [Gemmatimonadota bacterium]|nr:cold shock domain-containing protein [Gemmatimonadota bacterium]MDH5803802.1 cold shock domain-containing protein [Gemmatimonadota bacterium]